MYKCCVITEKGQCNKPALIRYKITSREGLDAKHDSIYHYRCREHTKLREEREGVELISEVEQKEDESPINVDIQVIK